MTTTKFTIFIINITIGMDLSIKLTSISFIRLGTCNFNENVYHCVGYHLGKHSLKSIVTYKTQISISLHATVIKMLTVMIHETK